MAVDIQKLFNEDLPTKVATQPDTYREIGGKYQFIITGYGGGEWFIDLSDSGPKVELGNPGAADYTITFAAEDFQTFYEDPQTQIMQLKFAGKVKIVGDPKLETKVPKLFQGEKAVG